MSFSLYDASVANFVQTLGAVGGFLERSKAHCAEQNVELEPVLDARLAPDMWPLKTQIFAAVHHSGVPSSAPRPARFIHPPARKRLMPRCRHW